jgi:membrane protein
MGAGSGISTQGARMFATLNRYKNALLKAAKDIDQRHLIAFSASLAYYFFLSLLPALVFLASLLAYLPLQGAMDQIMTLMARLVPPDSLQLVQKVLHDIMATRNGGILSFGLIGTLWSASGGISAMMEALNIAYDVQEGRPWFKKQLTALGLTVVETALVSVVLASMVLGPNWGGRLANHLHAGPIFTAAWFYFRWILAGCFAILAVELLYYVGPNVKQRHFWRTVPGAMVAVGLWVTASFGFGFYVQHFANYSKSYGALGAVVALLLWFFISSAAILIGAEVNQELMKACGKELPMKETVPPHKQEDVEIRRAS